MPYPDLDSVATEVSAERIALFEDRAEEYLAPERMAPWKFSLVVASSNGAGCPTCTALALEPIDLSRTALIPPSLSQGHWVVIPGVIEASRGGGCLWGGESPGAVSRASIFGSGVGADALG